MGKVFLLRIVESHVLAFIVDLVARAVCSRGYRAATRPLLITLTSM